MPEGTKTATALVHDNGSKEDSESIERLEALEIICTEGR